MSSSPKCRVGKVILDATRLIRINLFTFPQHLNTKKLGFDDWVATTRESQSPRVCLLELKMTKFMSVLTSLFDINPTSKNVIYCIDKNKNY
jgi:hypothetical protein